MTKPTPSSQPVQDLFSDLGWNADDSTGSAASTADGQPLHTRREEIDHTPLRTRREARQHLEREVAAQVARALAQEQAAITATLDGHQKALRRLGARVERLEKRRGGGVPWGLLLLAGGAYGASVLYRRNPRLQAQVQDLLRRIRPEPEPTPGGTATVETGQHDGHQVVFRAGVGDVHRATDGPLSPPQDQPQTRR